MRSLLAALVSVAAVSVPAMAQDYSATPSYGSVNLSSGFAPDPYNVQLTSGGVRAASNISSSCRGWIANAPDFSLYYEAGSTFDLTIGAVSNSDTTLVINGPSTNWYCDDDSGEGLNPSITFTNPRSGRYDIWVGSYREGDYASATLSISELGLAGGSPSGGGNSYGGIDWSLPANFGSASLRGGFAPDPYTVNVVSGGAYAASSIDSSCRGWVSGAPDFELSFSAGSLPLTIAAMASGDTTLLVNDPNGNWYCNDDGGEGLNPLLTFSNPASGTYDIWVGSYSEGRNINATLSISELGRTSGGGGGGGGGSYGRIDWSLPANFGSVSLRGGFTPDPYRVDIVSGGTHQASEVRSGCSGWVSAAPDFELTFSPGSLPLILSAASSGDTTILVNDPNGNWHCNDDGGNSGLNPALTFHNPAAGTYDIWIGSYRQGQNLNASLSISELYSE
ncbi:hypothetical protein [Maricaulis parjimensis]|uniref:hypothetical protein n=1 Tax=Maricaulis parjimensis TaxID=144023 RepID=UPI0019395330|nr:hypothetical protein [Maricaulis parjimensis]